MSPTYATLLDVASADAFPDVDIALRRGRHIGRDDGENYSFLVEAQAILEAFYSHFGCDLIHKADGYFYLLPTSDRLGRRHLSSGEMLVGQALTLLYLDPATVEHGGVVTRDQVVSQIAGALGTGAFLRAMNPKRRRPDDRMAEETARQKVAEALRRLAALGFISLNGEAQVQLRPALLRFAEPVRAEASPEASLQHLVDEGELVLVEDDDPGEGPNDEGAAAREGSGPDEGAARADEGDGEPTQ